MTESMIWISNRSPRTAGLYGVILNEDRSESCRLVFGYWDGTGWKIPTQSDVEDPYRPVKAWCKLQLGTDWNGYD